MEQYELKREMNERYREALPMWEAWWVQADLDTRIAMGDQNAWSQYWSPNVRINKQLYFNKILRVLNMIGGYQRKNRLTSIVNPVEGEDQETADQLSGALQWVMQSSNAYNTISDAFDGSLQCGLNMLSVWMDYRNDPENGDIKLSRLGYNSFIMDPFFTSMEDASWVWSRRWLGKEDVIGLYPEIEKELPKLSNTNVGYSNRGQDMKFLFQPQATYQKIRNLFAYDEYWVREHRKAYKVLDTTTGELMPWKYSPREFEAFREIYPLSKLISVQIPTIRRYVMINGELVSDEQRPWGLDKLPFVPVMCYHTPDIMYYEYRIQGVVRTLRDSQLELNRRRNKALDVLDSQMASGFIVKEDALVDPTHAYMTGPGKVLFLKDSANLQTDIQQIPPPPPDVADMQYQEMLEKELMENAGTTEELFGMGDDKLSGIHAQLRQGAALVGLQGVFDRLNLSQKLLGNIYLDLIQENFSAQKVQRIIKKQPTEQFFSSERERLFDCVVEQGLLTATQREMRFAQLLQLKEVGVFVPDDLLMEDAPIQGKQKYIEAVRKAQEQQAKQAQMQMDVELKKLQSEINLLDSNAENQRAAGAERQSRAVSNIGLAEERIAKADEDRAQAALDHAKALREIEELDINNLGTLVNISNNLQQERDTKQKSELKKTVSEAGAVGAKARRK